MLLDEDVDVRFRFRFGSGVEVETAHYRGWKGKKNGELLELAEKDFDVLVTGDGNLAFQQNVSEYDIGIIVLRPRTKALEHLTELVPEIERVLRAVAAGQLVEVFPPAS